MVLFVGFETSGYRIIAFSTSEESGLTFDQYYPLDIDQGSIFDNQGEIAYKICEDIDQLEKKLSCKFKKFYMVCQNSHVLVKAIEVLKNSKKKDIDLVIDIEIMQLMNLSRDDYCITYAKGQVEENDMVGLDVCIFPNYFYNIARFIEKNLKIRCQAIYSNYQVAEKFMDGLSDYFAMVEIRQEDLILSLLDNGEVENSIVVDQAYRDENFISYLNSKGKILVFGDYSRERFNELIQSLTSIEIFKDYTSYICKKILEEDRKFSLPGKNICASSRHRKNILVDFYSENIRKSKTNIYLVRSIILIFVFYIVMTSQVFMANHSLNKELDEVLSQTRTGETRQYEAVKKIDGNIYGLDIVGVHEIHKKLGKMVKKIECNDSRLLLEFEVDDKGKIRSLMSDKVLNKASILSINSFEYYVEEEVEHKREKKPEDRLENEEESEEGASDEDRADEKFELVKEKVKKKKNKYAVKIEIKDGRKNQKE